MIALSTETNGTGRQDSASDVPNPATADRPGTVGGRPTAAGPAREPSYEQSAGWLQNEAERLFTQGQYGAAEQKVRELLELQNSVVGQQHADFALGLSMLGELRFLQGDRAGAETLFRRALGIRERVLGRAHPDYAVSLTCLASMLWRRDALDEAERCLREALAIRDQALGPTDPETSQGRKELVRLLRQRGQWSEAHNLIRLYHAQALPADWHGSEAGDDLSAEVVVLASKLARLGTTLATTARAMTAVGTPPDPVSVRELRDCRQRFDAIQGMALQRIAALQVPNPPAVALDTLEDLATVLDDLGDAEFQQYEQEELRQRALTVLDRVLALECRAQQDGPPLQECQAEAARLRDTIASGHWTQLPTQAESLAEGTHALVDLLILVEQADSLCDDDWADLYEMIGDALGKPLAIAASRARLAVRNESVPPAPDFVDGRAKPGSTFHQPGPVGPSETGSSAAVGPWSEHTPRTESGLLRELAMASLVPTMGTVINLPSASPTDVQAHRLLRGGFAPKVVERPDATSEAANRTGAIDGSSPSPRASRRNRLGARPTINAGPLALLNASAMAGESNPQLGRVPFGSIDLR